ncbi:MAG: GNAT family N-acetyltransferase [Patescibacteria group bacterium]
MPSIKLVKFNEKFLESIKDYKKIYLNPKKGIFYTITYGNKIAGVIGYIIKEGGKNILKIGIHQKYRGQDIFRNALDLLVKTHKIKKIYSTVLIANLASIKAHRKIGFRRIPKRIEEKLKTNGILLKRNTRMVKSFK